MKNLSDFTQLAYLKSAAIRPDAEVHSDARLAYLLTPSRPERWYNGFSRCHYGPEDFETLARLTLDLKKRGINFNWHLWTGSSHPALYEFLTQRVGMVPVARGQFLSKEITPDTIATSDFDMRPLGPEHLEDFVRAKMLGWGNTDEVRAEVRAAAEYHLGDPRNVSLGLWQDSHLVAAVSAYCENHMAYLRGDFVLPDLRGRGLYRELVAYREAFLAARGVRYLTGIADESSSEPILRRQGYEIHESIRVLALRPTPWVSL
ncbi:MAG TPA: GNAT family N-acetyltransferase [Bdellovibrionota bacterium]|nr:GNAT family N-acetyltransferase [Bdellovibrionota bacterium]